MEKGQLARQGCCIVAGHHCTGGKHDSLKVHHVDAHMSKDCAPEEHQNHEQVDKVAKIGIVQVDMDWEWKGELFIAQCDHETSGHLGRDATHRWARDRGVDLTMETITHIIHECETCGAIK
ncbi:hypothetical protein BTVI_107525 [Pitangus sulphuratus]|nr:hypothetical protein BTVI_107525 [Pitangus sulphuratus]